MTGAPLPEKTPLERTIQSWGGLFGAAGAGGAAAFLQSRRFGRVAANAASDAAWEDDDERWEAGLRQQNAANDELCSENGRLRAEIERLRAEEETAADAAASAGGAGPGDAEEPAETGAACAPEDEAEEELLEAVGAVVWEVLAQWPSTPIGVEPPLCSEDATDGEEPAVECAVAAGVGGEETLEAAASPGVEAEDASDVARRAEEKEEELDKDEVDNEAAEKEEGTTTTSEEAAPQRSVSGVASPDGEWQGGVVATVEAAVRAALLETASSTTPEPVLTPAEETAVLVAEKIALRELVERQQERIEAFETQLHEAGAALPLGAAALGGALVPVGGALAVGSGIARGLHDASGALSAGLSAVLAPKATKSIAEVGVEYEVVGRKGTIVRSEESLRSEQIADLPPGTRVRVVSVSEKYPRRVEIVAVQASASTAGVAAGTARTEDGRAESLTAAERGVNTELPAPGAEAGQAPEPPTPHAPIVGWISASTKDGMLLIQPVPSEPGPPATSSGTGETGSAEPESREEGNEEVAQVTLSSVEWDCLHRDREASLRRVEALSSKLNETGRELLQSFEMRSVLGELQQGVERAHERSERMRETAALAYEELEQCRARHRLGAHSRQGGSRRQRRGSWPKPEADSEVDGTAWEEVTSSPSSSRAPREVSCGGTTTAATSSTVPGSRGPLPHAAQSPMLEAVDWDRLLSERETTAAALSAALRRAVCLEREAAELQAEREAAERCGRSELQRLREKLRRVAKPSVEGPGPPSADGAGVLPGGEAPSLATCGTSGPSSDGLFRRCVEDLQHTVSGLKLELRRASASEVALRRSVEARSSALRTLLHRGATAGLSAVQCGPLKLPASIEAERRALVLAVEEQLRFNLLLRNSRDGGTGTGGAPSVSRQPADGRRNSGHVDCPGEPKYTMLSSLDSDSA